MPLIALFFIATVSWIIVQAGATALKMTGLSRSVAEFQAISCFFGVGFTTSEAEMIVSHPMRRRIASHLIVIGNIGLTSAVGAFILTFSDDQPDFLSKLFRTEEPVSFTIRLAAVLIGVGVIAVFFRLGIVKRVIDLIIHASLERTGAIRVMDYETVLRSNAGFSVMQVELDPCSEHIGRTLGGAKLGSSGVLVLCILRESGEQIGTPHPTTPLLVGDVLTVYGHEDAIRAVLGLRATS